MDINNIVQVIGLKCNHFWKFPLCYEALKKIVVNFRFRTYTINNVLAGSNNMAQVSKNNKMVSLVVAVLAAYLITIFFLLILAFLMLKAGISGTVVSIGIVLTYLISNLIGGFYMGRHVDQKKYLWGLCTSGLYFLVYLALAVSFGTQGASMGDYANSAIWILAGGAFGGMLS